MRNSFDDDMDDEISYLRTIVQQLDSHPECRSAWIQEDNLKTHLASLRGLLDQSDSERKNGAQPESAPIINAPLTPGGTRRSQYH